MALVRLNAQNVTLAKVSARAANYEQLQVGYIMLNTFKC